MRNHTRTLVLALFLAVVGTSTVACKGKDEKAQKEADKARKTADDKGAEADKAGKVAEDKAAEAAKANKEADDKAAVAKKEAAETLAKAHSDARAALQKDVDAADRKTLALKEKVAKATGAMKKNADAATTELDTRREAVKTGMVKLETAVGVDWDTAKTQVAADTAALNKAIDALEATLKK